MSPRPPLRLVALAAGVAIVLAVPTTLSAAQADPAVVTINLQGSSGLGTMTYSAAEGIEVVDLDTDLQGGCGFPLGTGDSLCLGATVGSNEPLEVHGITVDPFVRAGGETADALRWIVDEGVQAIRGYYDVPLDYRIERYAAPELRAYVHNRIIDILDKVAYDEPLTEDEAGTLAFVQRQVLDLDRKITSYAYQEYLAWKREGCGYDPPDAPAWVAAPITTPAEEQAWCLRAHNRFDTLFVFAPPSPSASHFLTWGMYRNAADLGLDGFDEATSQAQLMQGISAGIVLGGIATAIAASGATAAIVGSSAALSAAAAGAMGSFAATSTAVGVLGPAGVASAFASVGPAAAATVVAVVILAAVVISVSIMQIADREQIGATLQARMSAAARATDPFGLVALAAERGSLGLREGLTSANLPGYRKPDSLSRMWQLVSQWTSIDRAGVFHPDAVEPWSDNATTVRDYRFEVRVDGGPPEIVDAITVPIDGGSTATVRFSKAWLIVTPAGGQPDVALSFGYLDESGDVAYASRFGAGAELGFVVTQADAVAGTIPGARRAAIRYLDDAGRLVEARLVSPAAELLAGPRPTAVGPLTPGRVVTLRPNPVSETGEFALERFRDDYSYAWEVTRFDTATQGWIGVPTETPADYGTRFAPDAVGDYRAVVTMTDLVGDEPEARGVVEFAIAPPVIGVDLLELDDPGEEQLELSLRLSEQTPADDFEVTVRWPGAFGEEPVVQTRSFPCGSLGIDCESALQTFAHTLDPYADVSQGVLVTIANGFGSSLTRRLEIAGDARVGFAAPLTAPLPEQLGVVEYSGNSASIQLPVQVEGPASYEVASIVPGGDDELREFGFYDPDDGTVGPVVLPLGDESSFRVVLVEDHATGAPVVAVSGQPALADIGVYEFPLVVQQNSPSATVRTAFLLRLDVVAAPGDRFRGALLADIGPVLAVPAIPVLEPRVIGGRAEWGEASERLCVSLEYLSLPDERSELCGESSDFFDADGGPLPFPYPELLPDGLREGIYAARIWLPDASERVSAEPYEVRFALTSGRPTIETLAWDASSSVVRMLVHAPEGTSLVSATCVLDDVPVACFAGGFSSWSPDGMTPGQHELTVVTTLDTGNYARAQLGFTVPPAPGGPDEGETGTTDPGSPSGPPGGHRPPGDPSAAEAPPGDTDEAPPSPRPTATPGGADAPPPSSAPPPAAASGDGFPVVLGWLAAVVLLVAGAAGAAVWGLRRRRDAP